MAEDPEGLEGDTARPRRAAAIVVVVIAVLALIAVIVSVVVVVFSWRPAQVEQQAIRQKAAQRAAEQDALAAARTAVVVLLSYDYRTFDTDIQKKTAYFTGDVAATYGSGMPGMADMIKRLKAVSTVTVVSGKVVGVEIDRVTVLVDTESKIDTTEGLRTNVLPMRLVMSRVDGRWLLAEAEHLNGPEPTPTY